MGNAEMGPRALDRRAFLKIAGLAALGPYGQTVTGTASQTITQRKADHTLHIHKGRVELAPGHVITTTTYNGQFPGPLMRSIVGRRMLIDLYNDSTMPENVRWHGQDVEGESFVPPGGMRRVEFTPLRPGLSLYHSNLTAAADLDAGLYSGQAGAVLIEPQAQPGRYDGEVILVLKEFEPCMRRTPHGCQIDYPLFSINGRMLGHGEPIRVNTGERLLFHILNASATETRRLALAGHTFHVIALDGNPVATPARVTAVSIGPSERVSALVDMKSPGIWILGDLADSARERGMGIVVEYAGSTGAAVWNRPAWVSWDYSRFGTGMRTGIHTHGNTRARMRAGAGGSAGTARAPSEILELVFARTDATRGGFNRWSVNGADFSRLQSRPAFRVRPDNRYRLRLFNTCDEDCSLHLQGQDFELASVEGRPAAGVFKDVITLGGRQQLEVDWVPQGTGPTVLQSARQLQRDFGLMARIDCG